MLDLEKNYGLHEGLQFFGDHESDNIVYYLPDEVNLSKKSCEDDTYDFFFQIFKEKKIFDDNSNIETEKAGSILQMDVTCDVGADRLAEAIKSVRSTFDLPEDVIACTPLWKDGTCHLITLDKSSEQDDSTDSFVDSIITTERPMLAGDIRSVFSVRYDKKGTQLIYDAISNGKGSIGGVMYNLQFEALRPALDLKLTANLKHCQDILDHQLEADMHIAPGEAFSINLNADLDNLTAKLVEDGGIVIEQSTMAETEVEQKMYNDLISEFKDQVLKELFTVSIEGVKESDDSKAAEILKSAVKELIPFSLKVKYTFRKRTIDVNRILQVDYHNRTTVIRTHSPQNQLWVMGKCIEDNLPKYISYVNFSDIWANQNLDVKFIYDFEAPRADLRSAELLVWRKKYGLEQKDEEARFCIPEGVKPIADYTFDSNSSTSVQMHWDLEDNEEVGYFYQLRLTYSGNDPDKFSPLEIVTKPIFSNSFNLNIVPDSIVFYNKIPISCRKIDYDIIPKQDVHLAVIDDNGKRLTTKVIHLDCETNESTFIIRGSDTQKLGLEVYKTYIYKDGSKVETTPIYLTDATIIVEDPVISKRILVFISGQKEGVENLIITCKIKSPLVKNEWTKTQILNVNDDYLDLNLNFYSEDDVLEYEVKESRSGIISTIQTGTSGINISDIIVQLSSSEEKQFEIIWDGADSSFELKKVLVQFFNEEGEELNCYTFKAEDPAERQHITIKCSGKVFYKITKKYLNGNSEKGKLMECLASQILVSH